MDFEAALRILQLLSSLASVIGIPVAIYVYWDNQRKERKEREYLTYNAIDEKYIRYLEICVQNPELDMYYLPLEKKVRLTAAQKTKQYALGEILLSLMERAYFMYADKSSSIKRDQWAGWDNYIGVWCGRENFREIWNLVGKDFDEKFYAYINDKMKSIDSRITT